MIISMSPDRFLINICYQFAARYKDKITAFENIKSNIGTLSATVKPAVLKTLTCVGHADTYGYGEKDLSPEDFVNELIVAMGKDLEYVESLQLYGCEIGDIQNQRSYALDVMRLLRERGLAHIKVRALNELVFEKPIASSQLLGIGYAVISPESKKKYEVATHRADQLLIKKYRTLIEELELRKNAIIKRIGLLAESKSTEDKEILERELIALDIQLNTIKRNQSEEYASLSGLIGQSYTQLIPYTDFRKELEWNDNFKTEVLEKIFELHPLQQKIIMLLNNVIAKLYKNQDTMKPPDKDYESELARFTKLREATYDAFLNPQRFIETVSEFKFDASEIILQRSIENLTPSVSKFKDAEGYNKFIEMYVPSALRTFFMNSMSLRQSLLEALKYYSSFETLGLALSDLTNQATSVIATELKESKDISNSTIDAIAQFPLHPRLTQFKWLLCEELLAEKNEHYFTDPILNTLKIMRSTTNNSDFVKLKNASLSAYKEYQDLGIYTPHIFSEVAQSQHQLKSTFFIDTHALLPHSLFQKYKKHEHAFLRAGYVAQPIKAIREVDHKEEKFSADEEKAIQIMRDFKKNTSTAPEL